jgi:hypothetical protein
VSSSPATGSDDAWEVFFFRCRETVLGRAGVFKENRTNATLMISKDISLSNLGFVYLEFCTENAGPVFGGGQGREDWSHSWEKPSRNFWFALDQQNVTWRALCLQVQADLQSVYPTFHISASAALRLVGHLAPPDASHTSMHQRKSERGGPSGGQQEHVFVQRTSQFIKLLDSKI